jgi:hypothetical protein
MNKVSDFYKKAESDEKIRADLEAANKRFEGQQKINWDSVVAEVIKIAARHGTRLEPADFEAEPGELDKAELETVVGGTFSMCVTPGQDTSGKEKKDGNWAGVLPQSPSCTAYGNNPRPVLGITIKIK